MPIKNNKNKGFTLIELLVVVAIIGLLSSIITASFSSVRVRARDTKRVAEMRSIEKAINIYALNTNGYVPMSIYPNFTSIPHNADGSIICNDPGLVNFMNDFYDTLIQAKALSSRPTADAQASRGYCYVYISDASIVAGASYDQNGNYISSGSLVATISNKVRYAVFGTFLENTKTVDGYQAFAGISYGSSLPMNPNINLTTGLNVGTNYNTPSSNSGPEFGSCDVNDPYGSCYSGPGSDNNYCDVNDPYGSCYSGGSGSDYCDVNDPYGSCYGYCDINDPYGSCYGGSSGSYCDVNDPYGSCYSGSGNYCDINDPYGGCYCDVNDPYGSCYSGSGS